MVFSSAIFLFAFLPLTFIGSLLIRQRWAQNAFLTLASLIFYAFGEPVYVFLMIASAGVNYGFGRGIVAVRGKRMKRLLLVLAVICDLAVLGVFKYAGFAVTNVNALFGIALPVPAIRLPVGISFFTFQAMSYVIDVYRNRDMCQKDFMKVLLYISFFPQLIAGPIVRWNEIEEQIDHRCLNETEIADGICRFVKGLFKKLIFANGLGKVADHVFALNIGQYGMAVAWLGAVCYALQIFYDFSGYSDMAIGMASMFGFHFQENFKHPYSADSIHEFWRRWHISLSSWLRDYLYISLGGNRRGKVRTYFNLFITMVLGGLWHGASWLFVIWGAWHGVLLIVHKVYRRIFPVAKDDRPGIIRHFFHVLLTFHVVAAGWIFFRSPSLDVAGQIFTQIFTNFRPEAIPSFVSGYAVIFVALIVGYLLHFAPHRWSQWLQRELSWSPLVVKAAILALVLFFVLQVRSSELVPFIYSQF